MSAGQGPYLQDLQGLVAKQNEVLLKSKELIDGIFEKGMTYSKVIIGIGYGGLIAVWSGTRHFLSPKHALWAALLFVISLCAYAIFEVGNMFYLVWLPFAFQKQVQTAAPDLGRALRNFEGIQKRASRRLLKAWAVALLLTIPTGFGAAGILVWGFLRQL